MRRLLRLLALYHAFLIMRWYLDALSRAMVGEFWTTNKLWLTFAYKANPWAWEELVWRDVVGEKVR